MDAYLKSLISSKRIQTLILGSIVPVILTVFLFAVLIAPDVRSSWLIRRVREAALTVGMGKSTFITFFSVLIAAGMFLCQRPLYQVLEGISWPERIASRRTRSHRLWAHYLEAAAHVDACENPELDHAAEAARQSLEKATQELDWRGRDSKPRLPRRRRPLFTPRSLRNEATNSFSVYPGKDKWIMPTRFGNLMRAMETYGVSTFGLDSQIMSNELQAAVPASTSEALAEAQFFVDTAVFSVYCLSALTVSALASAVWLGTSDHGIPTIIWVAAGGGAVAVLLCYRALLGSVEAWADATRALVNLGRKGLAESLGLRIPPDLATEKEMWKTQVALIYFADDPDRQRWDDYLQQFRIPVVRGPRPARIRRARYQRLG